jgi:DNA (cytosine-5)-methyltransferase 1
VALRFIDLFAGIGGFRLGMEAAGHKCVGWVEIDEFARKSYEAIHNAKGEWTASDIRSVTDDDLGLLRERGIDVICGGFPCQAFSVAGKRGGFSDTRGTLFFEIARFAKQIKPRLLFLENVKGLLSHDKGKTFATILNTLDELGYDAEWQVLNSKDFGVPQNRERVFIIGHLRGAGGRGVFPVREEHQEDIELPGQQVYTTTITTRYDAIANGSYIIEREQLPQEKVTVSNVYGGFNEGPRFHEGYSPTIRTAAGGGHIPSVIVKERIRQFTPKETWRLQGYPDWAYDIAEEVTKKKKELYKQAGNSVTVNVIEAIAKRLEG